MYASFPCYNKIVITLILNNARNAARRASYYAIMHTLVTYIEYYPTNTTNCNALAINDNND